jgi:hypothetical protein
MHWKNYVGPYMSSSTPNDGVFYYDGISNLVNANYGEINSVLKKSTPINTLGHPSVRIKFYQLYKSFNADSTFLEISNDNVNWYSIDVNPITTANQYAYGWKEYNISTWAADKAQVWIRFRFAAPQTTASGAQYGGGYGWMIDDVTIEDNVINSIKLNKIWMNDGYSQIPVNQNRPISLDGRIENYGSSAQLNVKLNAKELNSNINYSNSNSVTLLSSQQDTLTLDSIVFPNIAGNYKILPYASSNSVAQAFFDDTLNITLNNNNLFSRDNNYYSSSRWNNGDGCTIATLYKVKQQTPAYSINFVVNVATKVNSFVKTVLYKGIGQSRVLIAESDYYSIQANDIPLTTGANPPSISLPFLSPVVLEADSIYWAGVAMYGGADTVKIAVDNTAQLQNYETETIYDNTNNQWYVWSFEQQYPSLIRLNLSLSSISVNPSFQNIGSASVATQFSVTTNGTWTASSNQTWCTVTPSGVGSGTLTATIAANTSPNPRSAVITIIDNALYQIFAYINQEGTSLIPADASYIIGPSSVYQGQTNVSYTTPVITNATSYIWTLPTGATGISSSNSISVNFGNNAISGIIMVQGMNSVGLGNASSLYITVNPLVNNCSANFSLVPDTNTLHNYNVLNNAAGVPPLNFLWSWGDGTYDTVVFPSHTYSVAGYYNICLTITDAVGCIVTYCDSTGLQKSPNSIVNLQVVQGTVGIYNVFEDNFTIYPNPALNNLIIEIGRNKTFASAIVSIYDIQGKQLLHQNITEAQTQIDISSFAKGIYIVKLQTDKETLQSKFVKE